MAFGDAAHAHGLHQVIDRARRDTLDIGLLYDGRQSLFGHAPWLKEAGEIAAGSQLWNPQLLKLTKLTKLKRTATDLWISLL